MVITIDTDRKIIYITEDVVYLDLQEFMEERFDEEEMLEYIISPIADFDLTELNAN